MGRTKKVTGRRFLSVVIACAFASPAWAGEPPASSPDPGSPEASDDLALMSLEDLMNIEVTSASKRAQKISDAPAAIAVITQDDIRRSGMQNIPELLRLAPGMDVARQNASMYAISARGFNDLYSNKLLVLMDGREIYNPLFGGVLWETHDYILPDLDRIEVIRGPGGTLWGANAVNGVINITSKSARDTQGLLLDMRGGDYESFAGMRYGGSIGDQTFYRLWGKFSKVENFPLEGGEDANDRFLSSQGGLRVDHHADDRNTFTFQAGGFGTEQDTVLNKSIPGSLDLVFTGEDVNRHTGGHVLGRWTHVASEDSDFTVQVYYDRLNRDLATFRETEDALDLDFQHRFSLGSRQMITWGLGYRQMRTQTNESGAVVLTDNPDAYRATAFIQDEITLVPDRLRVIVGTKLEHNSATDFEYQPSAKFVYRAAPNQTIWGAVSRAVRRPSRYEQGLEAAAVRIPPAGPGDLPVAIDVFGNPDAESEELLAFELGYRVQPSEALTVDVTGFFNRYDNLAGGVPGTPQFVAGPPPFLLIPLVFDNTAHAESYGVEVAANLHVNQDWRISASYSFLSIQVHMDDPLADRTFTEVNNELGSPRNQFQLHSYWDLTRDLELNASAYYVDSLPAYDVPSYIRVDVGLTWRPSENLSLTLGVQNLLDSQHPEFSGVSNTEMSSEVPRTVYGQLTWRH